MASRAASPWRAGRLTPGRRHQLMFGWMYEDHAVELDLFPPGAPVLTIGSGGDTTAALAGAGHQVTAVDISDVQLRYARARVAGGPTVTVTGTVERLMAIGRSAAAAAMPAWHADAMAHFLALADPAEQVRWWRRELDRPPLRMLLAAAVGQARLLAGFVRPGFRGAIPPRFDVELRRRIAATVSRYPNATNPYAWRLLLGRDSPGSGRLAAVGGVEWLRADVVEHLEQVPSGRYDAATLSNVLDGPPPAYAARLSAALRRALRPGAPIVLRSFAQRPPLPGRLLADRCPLWGSVVEVRLKDW